MKSGSFLSISHYLWLFIFVLHWNLASPQIDDSKDLLLTIDEKTALDRFKPEVINLLPEDYMKTDFYLIRWLRNKNLNVKDAKTMLLNSVKWRQENNIKGILEEDWSDFQQDFPSTFDTHDKLGRPIVTLEFGEWDFRAAVLTGKSRKLDRYLTQIIERYVQTVFEAQAAGKNVTRALALLDVDGFSLSKHACPLCMPVLLRWTNTMESYYPQFTQERIIINAPTVVTIPINAMKPLMSRDSRQQLKIFGTGKEEWMKYLDERVDRSQRTQRYGGTKSS